MIKSLLALTLVSAAAAAVACPDGFKSMDAKAPEERKPVVAEPVAAAQARSETS